MKNFLIIAILFMMFYVPIFFFGTDRLRFLIGPRFAVSFLIIVLCGFYCPNLPFFYLAIFLVFLASVRGRRLAVAQYILLAGLVVQVPYLISIGGHYVGLIDPLAILGIGAYLVSKFGSHTGYRYFGKFTVEDGLVAITFLIMAIGIAGFGELFSLIRTVNAQFLLVVVPYLFIRSNVRSAREYRDLMACFGVSSAMLAVFALYEAHFGWPIFGGINFHFDPSGVSKSVLRRGSALRAPATMSGPLALACYLTVGILALSCSRKYFSSRWAYYGAVAITFLGLLATQSRGSLVALAVALIVICIALRRVGMAVFACASIAVAGFGLYGLAQVSSSWAAFLQVNQPRAPGEYYDYRQLLLNRGMEEFFKHPLTGMRLQPVYDALEDITQGQHIVDLVNIYLVILLISGLAGFLPFVSLLISSIYKGFAGFSKVRQGDLIVMRAFCLAAFFSVLVQFAFMSFIDRIPMNFVMLLAGMRLARFERANAHLVDDDGHGKAVVSAAGGITARQLANELAGRSV